MNRAEFIQDRDASPHFPAAWLGARFALFAVGLFARMIARDRIGSGNADLPRWANPAAILPRFAAALFTLVHVGQNRRRRLHPDCGRCGKDLSTVPPTAVATGRCGHCGATVPDPDLEPVAS
jgi:hypothetical protein